MGFRDGSTRYDPDTKFHINLVCNRCGKIEDFDCVSIEKMVPNLDEQAGFQAQSYSFEVRGLCSSCRRF